MAQGSRLGWKMWTFRLVHCNRQTMERTCAPCAGISEAARTFMKQSCNAAWETVDLSAEGVKALREENSQVASTGCEAVQKEVAVAITDDRTINGVAVQWIEPQV